MKLEKKLKLCLEALNFYSKETKYISKSKKIKARILQDSGAIARRTILRVTE